MPKVYVHFEPPGLASGYSALTFGTAVGDNTSVNNVLREFVDSEGKNACGGNKSNEARLVLFVAERDDVFVVRTSPTLTEEQTPQEIKPREPAKASAAAAAAPVAQPKATAAATANVGMAQEVHPAVSALRDLIVNKQYRQARIELDDILKKVKNNNASLLILKAELVYLSSSDYDRAVDIAYKAVGMVASNTRYKFVLAQALRRAERLDEALSQLDDAAVVQEARAQGRDRRGEFTLYLDIIALKAEVLFDLGRDMQAAAEVNKTVSLNEAEGHCPTLAAYARFAMKYDKTEEALRALLKAVVLDQGNKAVRAMLAKIISSASGYEELLRQLPGAEKSAAALAFLATICKDASCIPSAVKLYSVSLQHNVSNANYALNLAHTHELSLDYRAALGTLAGFLRCNPGRRAGSRGFACAELLAALPADVAGPVGKEGSLFRYERREVGSTPAPAVTHIVKWVDEGAAGRSYGSVRAVGSPGEGEDADALFSSRETLSEDAQDLLAVAFTIVKVLYLAGRLSELPVIFEVVEPARCASAVPLHTTSVRNEQAYYVCVGQVLSERSKLFGEAAAFSNPLYGLGEGARRPLYVVGDSHVLPAAWSVVSVGGEQRLLEPRLVTGIKHWHLRQESSFYPKFNFAAAVASLPQGADVLFVLGEIDCREGLLLAVEKDVYAGVGEGVAATVHIFAQALKRMLAVNKFNIFVHPVLPILNETRPLVTMYNAAYRRAVLAISSPRCRWLAFEDEVCSGGAVRPEYVLDGTHIHPVYASTLIEGALNDKK